MTSESDPEPSHYEIDSWRARGARALYSIAWVLAAPLLIAYLLYRSRQQSAYRRHWGERFGFYGRLSRNHRPVIWVHAVSVGETRAAQPLIQRLVAAYPDHQLLLTNGTPTGRAANAQLYGPLGVWRCYLPYDHPWCARRFLRHYRPQIGVLMETELWPSLINEAQHLGVPIALLNGRLSERSLKKGQRWPALIRPALSQLSLIQAQTDRDAKRMSLLGRSDVAVVGNMKFDVPINNNLAGIGKRWRDSFGDSRIVLLASSRDGEEQRVLAHWHQIRPKQTILMIVPRHPDRFEQVDDLMHRTGLRVSRRADLDRERGATLRSDLILGDTMGEMSAYYALADVCIMGGSLLPFGGQNLIEACASEVPVVVGLHTYNFEEAAELAIEANAAVRVDGPEAAVHEALQILDEPERLDAMAANAKQFAQLHRGATAAALQALEAFVSVNR